MPENWYTSHNAVCPFYMRQTMNAVRCEGFLPRSITEHRFDRRDEFRAFQVHHCYSIIGMENCPIHGCLAKQYAARQAEAEDQGSEDSQS